MGDMLCGAGGRPLQSRATSRLKISASVYSTEVLIFFDVSYSVVSAGSTHTNSTGTGSKRPVAGSITDTSLLDNGSFRLLRIVLTTLFRLAIPTQRACRVLIEYPPAHIRHTYLPCDSPRSGSGKPIPLNTSGLNVLIFSPPLCGKVLDVRKRIGHAEADSTHTNVYRLRECGVIF